ncbi:MAG: dihydrodipicolinate synthase family protein [Alphaproteobacteria bacterium]
MAREADKAPVSGVYPMLYAFFDEDERLDRRAMRLEVESLLAAKVHGIAVLGLASESNKLDVNERRTMLAWAAEDVGGRVPLAVTVAEPSVPGQVAFVRAAADAGAAFVILQPPPVRGVGEGELLGFFGAVADASPVPVGIQNAPEFLGTDISPAGLAALARAHPNVTILKTELLPEPLAKLIDATGGAFTVLNGRAGQHMNDCLALGCAGIIPGAESADVLVRLFDLARSGRPGDRAEADRLYAGIGPVLDFLERGLDPLLVYGKRIMARRLGLAPERARPRRPHGDVEPAGLELIEDYARRLGPLPRGPSRREGTHGRGAA